jgi:TonB family protein
MSALAIHVGAIAIAKNKLPTVKLEVFSPPGDLEPIAVTELEPVSEESVMTPPLEQVRADQDTFLEENLKPSPVRTYRKARPAFLVRETTASLRSMKAMVTYAPRPVYPYEARRQHITGSGTVLLTVDHTLGTVTDVQITQSCGNAILDNATVDAFRRWRFKSGTAPIVQVPITYTLTGASY